MYSRGKIGAGAEAEAAAVLRLGETQTQMAN